MEIWSRRAILASMVLAATTGCRGSAGDSAARVKGRDPLVPIAEHHAHIRSANGGALLLKVAGAVGQDMGDDDGSEIGADALIAALDSAGVEKAEVLSVAYFWGFPDIDLPDREAGMRAENDWVAEQVARYPDRLYGACSVNPVDAYAPAEVQRCANDPRFSGLKLHFANSNVDLRDPDQVARIADVFRTAAANDLPIVVHMRTRNPDYGARDVRVFIEKLLSQAPHLPVQIAHMAGWGGYDAQTDEALATFIEAFDSGELDRSLYTFDLAAVVFPPERFAPDTTQMHKVEEWNAKLADRIRDLGTDRVLFGTDWSAFSIATYASALPQALPLNAEELADIMDNLGPMIARAGGR